MDRIAPRFTRCEPLRNAGALMLGLVSDIGKKNCWTLAELSGHASPDRLQHLLARAKWDADAVRDDLRGYVVDHLGDDDAVLVVDETGDVKKGSCTVGTQRQYTGTAGRIENAQVAVYLTYAAPNGHTPIDRELYLPKSWVDDPGRRERADVPADTGFATKPELAARMITRAVAAGTPARFATGDEVYGADPELRQTTAGLGLGYVYAVGSNRTVTTTTGTQRVDQLARSLPRRAWRRVSAGTGAKGQRWYSWALVDIAGDTDSGHHHLLVRRNDKTGELAYYRCYSPDPVTLGDYVRVAGWRWKIEETLPDQQGAGRAGRTPGPHLDLLASMGHPGPARARLPGRHHRRSTTHRSVRLDPRRIADHLDSQRIPQTLRRPAAAATARRRRHPGVVDLAAKTPSPSPRLPPAQTTSTTMNTIYGCSTSLDFSRNSA